MKSHGAQREITYKRMSDAKVSFCLFKNKYYANKQRMLHCPAFYIFDFNSRPE